MIVTWVTFDPTANSTVEYGIDNLDNSAVGTSTLFVDGGTEKRKLYIHRVTLKNLKPNQKYSKFNIMQIILFYAQNPFIDILFYAQNLFIDILF